MIWPPSLLGFRIGGVKWRFGLWLPLFLVWLPLVFLLALLMWPKGWGKTLLLTGPWLFRMFCALRGLVIDVKGGTTQVYIVIR